MKSDSVMQQIVLASDKIFAKEPEPVHPSADTAVVIHLFYPDVWPEIAEKLKALRRPFDLYINLPPHLERDEALKIFADFPDATVYSVENRGRDVLPFLRIVSHFGLQSYRLICKLHTKKTGESMLGHVWRKLLYFDLIGSPETVEGIVAMFDSDETIGQVTGQNTVLDSKRYAYGNNARIKELCELADIPFPKSYRFAGGTMFWTRPSVIEPVVRLVEEGRLVFEEERGQKDHTMAHAVERFFGIVAEHQGLRIAKSPADYTKLDKETIDEMAALVLGQQYAGEQVFETLNRKIEEMQKLQALAESMRLKNRLKRLPKEIVARLTGRHREGEETVGGTTVAPVEDTASSQGGYAQKALKVLKGAAGALKSNPALLKKVARHAMRGEFGFMLEKIRQKSLQRYENDGLFEPVDPEKFLCPFDAKRYAPFEQTVAVIIPVYNGFEYLEKLFESIEKHTTSPYRLIVVEDASPDARVRPFLHKRLKDFDGAELIEHDENRGFVQSVSEAVARIDGHFVILNTDTEVPPGWLERLMRPIYDDPKTASVTPFTNAGTICSFPLFLEDNEIFEGLPLEVIDRAFADVCAEANFAEIPTGVGFCMGVNYETVKAIGFFDRETFGLGYGEENDWCQRAIKAGYKNLLVPNLFVYHKHGGSFPSELKQQLLKENHVKLLERHPDYDRQVQAYVAADPHKTLRRWLTLILSSKAMPLWTIFDHNLGGGANHYAREQEKARFMAGENILAVRYDFYAGRYHLSHRFKQYRFDFALENFETVLALLQQCDIAEIFLNDLVSFRYAEDVVRQLSRSAQKSGWRLVVPIHDYYPVCPSYTLLNDKNAFCGVPESMEVCIECMKRNDGEWRTFHLDLVDIPAWRTAWAMSPPPAAPSWSGWRARSCRA